MTEMSTPLALLRERLENQNLTCIVQKDDRVLTSRLRGIRPLLDWIAQGENLRGAYAADRIIGKAAAMLYVLMGVKGVFAEVLSDSGLAVLKKYGVCEEYAALTPNIKSRDGSGLCPMEQTVLTIDEPFTAYVALSKKAEQLRKAAQEHGELTSEKMTNRKIAALETRKKLLETAKVIIREKGLVNTSIEEITKACGVANGTFYTYFKRKEDVVFALSHDIFREIYDEAQRYDGPFMDRLAFYMVTFSGHIERNGLKLCQEWVRNTVDPNLVENPYDKEKLRMDNDSMKGMIKNGVERGELKEDAPIDALADALTDVIYGEMLCWDMSGGAYSFEERTKKFCAMFLPAMMKPYLKGNAEQ